MANPDHSPNPNSASSTAPRCNELQHSGIRTLPGDGPHAVHAGPVAESESRLRPPSGTDAPLVVSKDRGWLKRRRGWSLIAAVVLVSLAAAVVGGAVRTGGSEKGEITSLATQLNSTSTVPPPAETRSWTTSSVPSSTTQPSPSPSYLGCYFDDENRALREASYTDPLMTPSLCNSFCDGFPFYAVEYSDQCFCGKVLHEGYPKVGDGDCDHSCGGNATAKCGGLWRLNLYSCTGQRDPPATRYRYTPQGCFIDRLDHGLGSVFRSDSRMTPQLCVGMCAGYRHAGVECGDQCFCGNTWASSHSKVADQECNYTCTGDPTLTCGGLWRLNLYTLG